MIFVFFPHVLQNHLPSVIVREIVLGIKKSCLIVFKSDIAIQIFSILVSQLLREAF